MFCSFSIRFTITKFSLPSKVSSLFYVCLMIWALFSNIFFLWFCIAFFAYVHGYFCWHHVFYRLDVNECIERRICPGYCENTIGSYICTSKSRLKIDSYEDCPPGYQWESTTGLCSGMSVYNLIIILNFLKYISNNLLFIISVFIEKNF